MGKFVIGQLHPMSNKDYWIFHHPYFWRSVFFFFQLGEMRIFRWNVSSQFLEFKTSDRVYLLTYLLIYLLRTVLTNSLTAWSRVLLDKYTVSQLFKEFPAFYGTRRFITAFTTARLLSQFWARSIHSIPYTTSWRSILIVFSHLSLDLLSGPFP